MDIPGLVEYSNLQPLDPHPVCSLLHAGRASKFKDADEVFLAKVRLYCMKINPALTEEDFIEMRASRYRYAQPICEPGYLDRLPPAALPVRAVGCRHLVLLP